MTSTPDPQRALYARWQRRTFAIAWLGYASFYLCRVNLAVALPAIQQDMGWTARAAGWIGSTFLWVYALGQLVNGALGQKANARWFVGAGMLVSALCNAAFGAAGALWLAVLLWGINGWAQSMGWGAIMKTIASWFDPGQRGRISALFSPCFVLGHLLAWSVGGWIASRFGWRYAFWLPALVFAAMGLVWLAGIRPTPREAGLALSDRQPPQPRETLREILGSVVAHPRLRWAALTCVFASMIKDGLNLWAPTFLVEHMGMSMEGAALSASILPLFGLLGSLLAGWLSDRLFQSNEGPGVMGLSLVIAAAMVGLLLLQGSALRWAAVALLGVCGVAMYGINALLLTSLPLSFAGQVGAVAGFLDFSSYVGGGISALIAGQLLSRGTWSAVFVYWLIATLIAFGSAAALRRHAPTSQAVLAA